MTTPTQASSQTAPANGNQAARQGTGPGASARAGQRSPADLFANLLGLLSASTDEPALPGSSPLGTPLNGVDAGNEADTDALLPDDPNAALLAQGGPANPLADLIGWPGAAALSTGGDAASAQGQKAQTNASGTPIDGMTPLDQPTEADADLMAQLKALASPSAGAEHAAPDKDAATVTYGDNPNPTESTADAAKTGRSNPANMGARAANWRSTTTLAPSASASQSATAGSSTPHNSTAALQANAVQQAQNAAIQRGPAPDPMQAASRPVSPGGERFSEASAVQGTAAELIAPGASGHGAKGHNGGSGSGGERDAGLLAGNTAQGANELDAPEEAFSLDAALEAEEELDGNAFLSPNQLRHASVRVGEGTDEAIDIRLSLEGDAVNVDFRTDNAEVRAGLQHNAGGTLSDLMQRGGVQLGGVSVGAQSQQSGGQSGSSGGAPARVGASSGRHASSANTTHAPGDMLRPRNPASLRSDGGPSLDLFA
jgi:flagellar hook-length control protein FliK